MTARRIRTRNRVKNAVVVGKNPALTSSLIEEKLKQQRRFLEASERARSLNAYRTSEVVEDGCDYYGVPRVVEAVNRDEAASLALFFVERSHRIPRA